LHSGADAIHSVNPAMFAESCEFAGNLLFTVEAESNGSAGVFFIAGAFHDAPAEPFCQVSPV